MFGNDGIDGRSLVDDTVSCDSSRAIADFFGVDMVLLLWSLVLLLFLSRTLFPDSSFVTTAAKSTELKRLRRSQSSTIALSVIVKVRSATGVSNVNQIM